VPKNIEALKSLDLTRGTAATKNSNADVD